MPSELFFLLNKINFNLGFSISIPAHCKAVPFNSILSAIDVDVLSEKDIEQIIAKLPKDKKNLFVINKIDLISKDKLLEIINIIKSYDKLRMLNRIIEDIVNKRTKLIKANVSDERINKMLDKNWTITGVYGALFIEKNSKESCYICLEEFASHVQFKYRCCNGRTHRRCMKKLIEKNNIEVQKTFDCSFCRTENNMTSLDHKLINSSA